MNQIYQNIKNKNLYRILYEAEDCTNSRSGEKVIVYCSLDIPSKVCVREEKEFYIKFTEYV